MRSQTIANYVNNGGFEDTIVISNYTLPRYWGATDTMKPFGELLSSITSPPLVPSSGYAYQWPRHGNNMIIGLQYCTTCPIHKRGYPRNRLKQALQGGKVYCVSAYFNLSNQSTHAIDAIGFYFGNNTLDTITKCNIPITYLTPQVQNPINNLLSDTLNWMLVQGQFTATGNEKYLMIGNYKSDANTNKILVNPTNLPANAADYLIDDVSCIDVDLPAYAGPDVGCIPGNSVYIGRPRDVGIDEACMWYQLPGMAPLDTAAGIAVSPVVTTTYVVKQDLGCGGIKWDTVVVYQDAVGFQQLRDESLELRVYPVPATDVVELTFSNEPAANDVYLLLIYNNVGVLVREEKLAFKEKTARINVSELENGAYVITIENAQHNKIIKKLLIAK